MNKKERLENGGEEVIGFPCPDSFLEGEDEIELTSISKLTVESERLVILVIQKTTIYLQSF